MKNAPSTLLRKCNPPTLALMAFAIVAKLASLAQLPFAATLNYYLLCAIAVLLPVAMVVWLLARFGVIAKCDDGNEASDGDFEPPVRMPVAIRAPDGSPRASDQLSQPSPKAPPPPPTRSASGVPLVSLRRGPTVLDVPIKGGQIPAKGGLGSPSATWTIVKTKKGQEQP